MSKITLYDVARSSGFSPKTVSRVINNEPSVSTKTRDLVNASIDILGYRPNNSARSLRTSRSYMLCLLYDNLSPAYVLDLQEGILSTCGKSGFNIIIHPCSYESSELVSDISNLLERSRIDGFILSPPLSDHTGLTELLQKKKTAYVRIAPINHELTSSYVYCNERQSAREMTDYLIGLGHREIGFITGDPNHSASSERLSGYKEALKNAHIPIKSKLIEKGDFSFESGESCARTLLKQKTLPTAIFASNDYMAAGVMKTAQQMGMRIPDDLSITGFDDAPVSRQIWPTLTTIRQPIQLMAARNTEILINNILKKSELTTKEEFQCELIIRKSTSQKP